MIAALGELHQGRKKIQPASWEIREFYDAAREFLKHELLILSDSDILVVADAFEKAVQNTAILATLARSCPTMCIY